MELYIEKTSFVGLLQLDLNSYTGFDAYADQIQEQILLDLLGYEVYKDMEATPTEQKYIDLLDGVEYTDATGVLRKVAGIKTMLPYFFYFYYSRDVQSYNSTLGEFDSLAENATGSLRGRLNSKIINNFNKGVAYYYQLSAYMEFAGTYTGYETKVKTTMNVWGI